MIILSTNGNKVDSQVVEDLITLVAIETKSNPNLITLFAFALIIAKPE